jgi:hypothetical protein
MQAIATVREIWRYPVKSMGGESLTSATVTPAGLVGDRLWAVLDADGEIKSARQWPRLIQMTARYLDAALVSGQLYAQAVPDVLIDTPDGTRLRSRTASAGSVLESFLGQACRLEPLRPPSDTDFYTPPKARNLDTLSVELDQLDDEPEFDFSQTPEEMLAILSDYMTPPGTFFDAFPMHLISSQTLATLARDSLADVDPKRFRPNLLLDFVDAKATVPEFDLLGKVVRIGATAMRMQGKTIRCSIPSRSQPLLGLSQDPNMTRAMVRLMQRHIGVYASIETPGDIQVGAPVFVDD